MKTVCNTNQCTGCMACVEKCPVKAISIIDQCQAYNAVIDEEKCIGCSTCTKVCQKNNPPVLMQPIAWYQGWTHDETIRASASSGGVASGIIRTFLEKGGAVCSCVFVDGEFIFKTIESEAEASRFIGSKYVKSNPQEAYRKILDKLKKGIDILFVGLPCQSAAVQLFVPQKYHEKLYTVDLICHGTPSPQLLNIFLSEKGIELKKIKEISFRKKERFQIREDYKTVDYNGTCDKYSIAFLNSVSYTENCYSCHFAETKRVSDLTLGDSWGSELPKEEREKGISLILCQTEKGKKLLIDSQLHLESVSLERAIEYNHQLKHPSKCPSFRKQFFDIVEKKNFSRAVWACYPKNCLKQILKGTMVKLKICGGGG